jgi:hypothetical protein
VVQKYQVIALCIFYRETAQRAQQALAADRPYGARLTIVYDIQSFCAAKPTRWQRAAAEGRRWAGTRVEKGLSIERWAVMTYHINAEKVSLDDLQKRLEATDLVLWQCQIRQTF